MELCGVTLALLVISVITLLLGFLHRHYSYWARRGVLFDKPVWVYGNLGALGKTATIHEPFRDFYNKYKGKAPFGGFYLSMRHAAVVLNLEMVKLVMIKDFANFADRGNYFNEKDDPLSAHLFNLDGPGWREVRTKLTPTFTSMKMHQMLPTVMEIAERFVALLQQQVSASQAVAATETPVEMKELLARFTTDVIGSCAFGLDCNSLNQPEVEFRVFGRKAFSERRHGRLVFSFLGAFPQLARRLHIKMVPDDVNEFYMRIVRETLEYRERHDIKRNDFLNLLMEQRKEAGGGLSFKQIAAQSFIFFLAGFETSSSTMGFALYLLATHPEVQQRARAEVEQVWAKHGGLNYDSLKELKYIQQVFYETMRMYAIVPILMRKAINDYQVPGTAHVIEAGTTVVIPADAIHHDPDIFPQPELFDPDRFEAEAVKQRNPLTWLPFGAGPRNCIGLRFGEMQSMVGLSMLLKHFRFSPAKETAIPLEIDKNSFITASKGGIVLNVQAV